MPHAHANVGFSIYVTRPLTALTRRGGSPKRRYWVRYVRLFVWSAKTDERLVKNKTRQCPSRRKNVRSAVSESRSAPRSFFPWLLVRRFPRGRKRRRRFVSITPILRRQTRVFNVTGRTVIRSHRKTRNSRVSSTAPFARHTAVQIRFGPDAYTVSDATGRRDSLERLRRLDGMSAPKPIPIDRTPPVLCSGGKATGRHRIPRGVIGSSF